MPNQLSLNKTITKSQQSEQTQPSVFFFFFCHNHATPESSRQIVVAPKGENMDANISNMCIHIRIMRLSVSGICIRMVITMIECDCYPLSAYEVISVLNYYLNLYVRLNNTVKIIRKLK